MSEWIRVEDQKPPEGPHCLVVLKWSDDRRSRQAAGGEGGEG